MLLCHKIKATVILCSLILSGCETPRHDVPDSHTQRQQLAALIASANWLRDRCHRLDIPAQPKIIAHALAQAKEKGWEMKNIKPQKLQQDIQTRYQAISDDEMTTVNKCGALNRASAPFLQGINR
ncbi:type II secretion system pilot lipoprotein GspS [Pantoea sp.]|uniref:type II secretion system pilot lipoprotein GspS n=1 Tax=Pantoea sp. TaxID=69393 RepID=UPI0031E0A919